MKSRKAGKSISAAEITNISSHGVWIIVRAKEYFLPYEDYPWFKDAKVREIVNVKLLHSTHLHWPDLDVDLCIDTLENLENYPLVYK